MGYLSPEAAVMGGTPSPYGSYAALPTQYSSPYVNAGGAAVYASPYVSSPQALVQGSPYQRPPSRPRTPVGYLAGGTTPPMGQLQIQASPWVSPGGGGYPATAYTSPAPAGYANPYASPAVGYSSPYVNPSPSTGYVNASPTAGHASPYVNASPAAGYASPYVNASPTAGYASPAGGYANLAAGYSSPYVPPLQGAGPGASGFYYS
ncbi:hypothetical protein B0H19DRAFT_1157958 [Mycena capillaripes]|nr:hypothetical protein B0H19DRAFT_1157958 [Mycena capillaripes]